MSKGGTALQAMDETCFICYCCCQGFGLSQVCEPNLCASETKFCCYKSHSTCDCVGPCGPEGCCLCSTKYCCCFSLGQFPPRPCFIELCGITLMGVKRGERFAASGAEKVHATAGNFGLESSMEEMRQEAVESIQNGNYFRAKELALLLEAAEASSGVPNSMSS
uniref:Uncharacterized protein n=2 Tax=Hanusia phi TaxID=3032 RepID=A0A7S0E582_9CRYP|mmetsp:Transcript_17058/g.38793  ORF Transcript_17058/g.38793 Transcript_17058/m.38793 type:complete len:164 (+) Transcript_17058:260-751(+)